MPWADSGRRHLTPWVLSALGFALTVALCDPGFMSPDSIYQLLQARGMAPLTDWHPLSMTLLWRVLDGLIPGPRGMLCFHGLLFWGGLAWLGDRLSRSGLGPAGLLPLAGFFPPVFSILGVVWKDISFGSALLVSVGCLTAASLASRRARRIALLAASLVFLAYGTSVRYNGLPAALPFCVWWTALAVREAGLRASPQVLATGSLALLTTLLLPPALLLAGTGADTTHPFQYVMLFDLAAIEAKTSNADYIPSRYRNPVYSLQLLRRNYDPSTGDTLFWTEDHPIRFRQDDDSYRDLRKAWISAILAHPGPYLEHRLNYSKELFAWGTAGACYATYPRVLSNPWGYAYRDGPVRHRVFTEIWRLAGAWVFRGWVWFLLGWAILAVGFVFRGIAPAVARPVILTLASSAILYATPYVLAGTGCDYRFLWWSVLATLLSILIGSFGGVTAWRFSARMEL